MNVKTVQYYTNTFTSILWLIGLAYYEWLGSMPRYLPLWELALLATIGALIVTVVICSVMDAFAAVITGLSTGNPEGSIDFYAWNTFICPCIAFFAAKYVLRLLS